MVGQSLTGRAEVLKISVQDARRRIRDSDSLASRTGARARSKAIELACRRDSAIAPRIAGIKDGAKFA